ncbi:MAG: zinc-ribbon domain-containing protein [Sulfurovum sp.]|nr:zinc-ribbon domain-containing protein [Sulfurovum sp.]
MSEIIVCPNCAQKNKVEDGIKEAKCGKCWSFLKKDKNTEVESSSYSWIFWLIAIGVVIFFLNQNSSSSSSSYSEPKKIKNNYPIVAMPYSGKEQKFVNDPSVAPLTIQTSSRANYLVKIVDYYSKSDVMTIFIKGGDTIRTKVPLGTFEIRYASGEQWYGYNYLFGDDTSYSKADQSFDFRNTGYQITGYTLTLYRVSNGNLRTSYMNPSEF